LKCGAGGLAAAGPQWPWYAGFEEKRKRTPGRKLRSRFTVLYLCRGAFLVISSLCRKWYVNFSQKH